MFPPVASDEFAQIRYFGVIAGLDRTGIWYYQLLHQGGKTA